MYPAITRQIPSNYPVNDCLKQQHRTSESKHCNWLDGK